MVLDTSALLAILLGEEEAEELSRAIADDPKRLVSAFSALEAAVVLRARKGSAATAFGLAVYPSQAPYGIGPRKTRFRLVASLCRAGFGPAGSPVRGFRSVDCRLHRFPLSQAYPGAPTLTLLPVPPLLPGAEHQTHPYRLSLGEPSRQENAPQERLAPAFSTHRT